VGKKSQKPDEQIMVTFEAPAKLVVRLDDLAEADRRSRSFVIRELLLQALAQNEKTA
jgi:predicted transcriptional regulator